ncbi:rhombosortase [Shewanella surugensis]|uniref:Rhombosortase n=2 Tax=Shewanella surugensis TaxID=212020 RepID=A0ABT0L980_9GAMM|nr:rhombosortase [Shewanella surugensis]MCL1124244.1 rhombosortase [Shewanella surugensis]
MINHPVLEKLKSPYGIALLISLVCITLFLLNMDDLLAYRRVSIEQYQWWRLITGNLLHTNDWHLAMNLGGLWAILLLHRQHYTSLGLLLLLLVLCLLQGLGLYFFYPSLLGYVGLSGVLHGLFSYGVIQDCRVGMKSGYLLLLGIIVKVAYEQVQGASPEVIKLIGARVATEAHLVGLISGLLCAGTLLIYQHFYGQCACQNNNSVV